MQIQVQPVQPLLKNNSQTHCLLTNQFPYFIKQTIQLRDQGEECSLLEMLQKIDLEVKQRQSGSKYLSTENYYVLISNRQCDFRLSVILFFELIVWALCLSLGFLWRVISFLVALLLIILVLGFWIVVQCMYSKFIWDKEQVKYLDIKQYKQEFKKYLVHNDSQKRIKLKILFMQSQKENVQKKIQSQHQLSKLTNVDEQFSEVVALFLKNNNNWVQVVDKIPKKCISIQHEYRMVLQNPKLLQKINLQIKDMVKKKYKQFELYSIKICPDFVHIPSVFISRQKENSLQSCMDILTRIVLLHSFFLRWKFYQTQNIKIIHQFTIIPK